MKNLKAKLRKNGGFTLIEMLIVVAIIAILVAVSIPVVSSSLERARKATDQANERAAKAEALVVYLDDSASSPNKTVRDALMGTSGAMYDASAGEFLATGTPTGYGRCKDHTGGYINVKVSATGKVTIEWAGTGVTADPHGTNTEV